MTLTRLFNELYPFKGYKPYLLSLRGHIEIRLAAQRKCGICPKCKKRCGKIESEYDRKIRDLNLGEKHCYLKFSQKKIRCRCGYRGPEEIEFVSKSRRVTKRMETFVVSLCEKMSLKEVATVTGFNWKTVRDIDGTYIKSLLPKISDLNIRRIAIDEIAIMKGHKYLTVIRDYDTGVAIKIFFSRTYEATKTGLESLGKDLLKGIQYVSLDMWDPYIKAITELCPSAKLVFDKFHIVKKINEALDTVRKKEFAQALPQERKNMKKKRFVILKREKNLKKEQKEELNKLMDKNERLYKAYLLKEQMLSIFEEVDSTFDNIRKRIQQWFDNVAEAGFSEFQDVVKTMQSHFYGILNYFRYGMTNAIAEGFNTKINVIKRRAFGYRDIEYFMLKIYQSSLRRLA